MNRLDPREPQLTEDEEILDALASLNDRSSDDGRAQIDALTTLFADKIVSSPNSFPMISNALQRTPLSLPIKTPSYATLVGLLTASKSNHAKELAVDIVSNISKRFSDSIRDGKTAAARRALRFLACLADCAVVTPASLADHIITLLEASLTEFNEPRSGRGVHCRAPFLAEIALSALPWGAHALLAKEPEKLKDIMQIVRSITDAYVPDKWRCIAPSTDERCVEVFMELLAAIFHLEENNWVVADGIVPRPQDDFEMRLNCGQELTLAKLVIPSHSKLTRYSCPRYRLCLVNAKRVDQVKKKDDMDIADDKQAIRECVPVDATVNDLTDVVPLPSPPQSDDAEMPEKDMEQNNGNGQANLKKEAVLKGANDGGIDAPDMEVDGENAKTVNKPKNIIEEVASAQKLRDSSVRSPLVNYILRCYVDDIVDNFSENHMMAAERLLTLPMFNNVNDEIVECVFSQMCSLPAPMHAHVYYGTLFVDLCRVKDSRLPAKLLTSVETMFQEAEHFDPESFDRLAEWFAFHLSNFGYKWNWADWAVYADEEMMEKFPYRALFCKDILARCIRLSYYDRIMKIIPPEMKFFIQKPAQDGNKTRFDSQINSELMKIVTGKGKQPPDVVKKRLEDLIPVNPESSDESAIQAAKEKANLKRLSSLVRSILVAGCKTLSHFDIVSERFEVLLREMVHMGGSYARRLVAQEVTTFWQHIPIRRIYVMDKLRARGVIDGSAIVDSCLAFQVMSDSGKPKSLGDKKILEMLMESHHWELVRLVFARARSREDAAQAELNWARKAAAAANEGESAKAEATLQQARTNMEKAKRDIAELLLITLRRLFGICSRLLVFTKVDNDSEPPQGEKRLLPGFIGKPIWYWRCTGMMRELARRHPHHLPIIIDTLDNDTKDNRDEHRVLWECFEVIKEVEGSAMLSQLG